MNRRIRVGHVITNYVVGGAQDYLLLIVRGLDRERFEPILMGRAEGEWVDQAKNVPGAKFVPIPSLRRWISPWHNFWALIEIWRVCRRYQIDILHTHSSKPGVVGRLAGALSGVPVIIHTVHGFSFHDHMSRGKRAFFVFVERLMSRVTTVLLVVSRTDGRTAERLGIVARRPVDMFYYGIDYAPFQRVVDRDATRRSFGYAEQHRVIGFTGRFSEQKALHILIEAFARISGEFPNARLLLVGDGPLRDDLLALARQRGVQDLVVFTGFRSDVVDVLSAMDLFVMTSLWEGLSRSLAEAMYARLPVIATDVGGTAEAVRNGETGWLIEANSVDAAVTAIRSALGNPALAAEMAEAGHSWAVRAFDVGLMREKIEKLYLQLYASSSSERHRGSNGPVENDASRVD